MKPVKLAILASGNGSNFEAIVRAAQRNELPAQIAGLVTNSEKAGALARAQSLGVPSVCLNPKSFDHYSDWDSALAHQLKEWSTDLVVAAGFLKKIGPHVLAEFSNQVLNTHPSLLPRHGGPGMYGLRVHQAVLAAEEKVTGVTIHMVNEEYDKGEVLAQIEVPVLEGDTPEILQDRVKSIENKFLVKALNDLIISRNS